MSLPVLNAHRTQSAAAVLGPFYTFRFDYDGSDNLTHVGLALPGSATSSPVWMIFKLTYSGTNMTSVLWADSNREFDNVWDDHLTITYG